MTKCTQGNGVTRKDKNEFYKMKFNKKKIKTEVKEKGISE